MPADRKPLALAGESKDVLPVRLHPSVIAGLKVRAARKGIGYTTLAREYLITGMSMDDAQELLKANTRVTA